MGIIEIYIFHSYWKIISYISVSNVSVECLGQVYIYLTVGNSGDLPKGQAV